MPAEMNDRAALVTGAGRGIGRAVAVRLAEAGYDVALVARTERDLLAVAATVEQAGRRALPIAADLTDDEELAQVVRRATARFGALSVLVNCAGFAPPRTPHVKLSQADIDRTLHTCLRAPLLLTRLCLGPMLERRHGAIVNIASRASRNGGFGEAAYSAAKAGLVAFGRTLFQEVRDRNVKVITLSPGYVDTAFVPPNRRVDRRRFLQPNDVADAVLHALGTPAGACCTEIVLEPQLAVKA